MTTEPPLIMSDILKQYFEIKQYRVFLNPRWHSRYLVNLRTKEQRKIDKGLIGEISTDTDISEEHIRKWINTQELYELPPEESNLPISPQLEIDLAEIGILPMFDANIGVHKWSLNNIALQTPEAIHEIYFHRDDHGKEKIITSDIQSFLETYQERKYRESLLSFRELVKHQPNLPDLFEPLAKHICVDKYDPWYPIILYQTLWTIKRRLYDLPDYCPLLLNFYGSGGCGKSEAINLIFSIVPANLQDHPTDCEKLFNVDEQGFRFTTFYVSLLGELSGLDGATLEKVKNSIDAKTKSFRLFFSQKIHSGRNVATMIGSSNKRLRNILIADADARKWAEIEFYEYRDRDIPEKMVNPLKEFDWLTLWRSVDEHGPSPFEDPKRYEDFRKWNTPKITTFTPTVEFIISVINLSSNQWISKTELWKSYTAAVEQRVKGKSNFYELVEKYGFTPYKKDNVRGYIIADKNNCKYINESDMDQDPNKIVRNNPLDEEDPNWSDNIKL